MFNPKFADGEPVYLQVMYIAAYVPFLYVGFEVVTHSIGISTIPSKRIYGYAAAAIITGMMVYVMLALTASSGIPEGFETWQDYLAEQSDLHGQELNGYIHSPVLFNAHRIWGMQGVWLVGIAAFCALATGVMGFHRAAAIVVQIMANAKLFPEFLAKTTDDGTPRNAKLLILFISLPLMLLGRTALGWNADVATFTSTVVYVYISYCALKTARKNNQNFVFASGIMGFISGMILFGILFLPNLFGKNLFAHESYLLLAVWSLLGMAYYWYILWNDRKFRFGKSPIMWLVMVFILFFSSIMWRQTVMNEILNKILGEGDIPSVLMWNGIFEIFIVLIATVFLFSVFSIMNRREIALHEKAARAEEHRNMIQVEKEHLSDLYSRLETKKNQIEKQQFEIQSSINYACRIQRSLLTPVKTIDRIFPDNFLLYMPRDVVSGDFYWVEQIGNKKVCVVADCTGHGVPGGFMSMLGMTNLNYIVGQELQPNNILNLLRNAIISSLRQKIDDCNDELSTMQNFIDRNVDGMDAAVFIIDEKEMTISYAGAHCPLLLIRDGELTVLPANKMPVGMYPNMEPFDRVDMSLRKGDCIYAYSDGFQDQYNSQLQQRFMGRRLRDLLLEIHDQPMAKQKMRLEKVLKEWQGTEDTQTDDILILGVRV